jgi:Zn-dependent peptidase ImmA (M78 family)
MAEESGPAAFMNGRGRPQRFTLSRAFWHYLWESDPVFLVTTAYTERQKVERAFAAELLAPADGIRKLLGTDPRDAVPEDLDGIAEHFGVSSMVIEHQVENQLLAA